MVTTYINEIPSTEPRFGASQSGVSWAAIFAGALAAAVLSLLLFMLGTGLGLSSISVWSGKGADGEMVGWSALAWLVITQLASAAVGGYLAGRLRTKWQGVHTDEVYFRDTAHGFLAWALATIGMVVLTASMLTGAVTTAGKAVGTVATGAAQVAGGAVSAAGGAATAMGSGALGAVVGQNSNGGSDLQYWINGLLRKGGPTEKQTQDAKETAQDVAQRARAAADDAKDVGVIFSHSLKTGKLSEEDSAYIANVIAQRSNISVDEAKQKVQQTFAQIQEQIAAAKQAAKEAEEKAKQAAEQARKATAYSLLWMFVVLLIGAFVGSFSATIGGRQRDNV